MTTLCLADDVSDTGTYHYRVLKPYEHLRVPLAARGISLVLGPQPACDVYIYSQTIAEQSMPLARALKKSGKKFVFGYDDHPWRMPDGYPQPAQWRSWQKLRRESLDVLADAVVATTAPLKQAIGGHWRRDAVVLPNLIDPADYQPVSADPMCVCGHAQSRHLNLEGKSLLLPDDHPDNPGVQCAEHCGCSKFRQAINVVFAGSPSHLHDVKILTKAITAAMVEFPQTVFHFLGCKPPAALTAVLFSGCKERLRWYPWVKRQQYPAALCALRPDIGLCPLIDSEFSRCKSAIKFYEMTLAGAFCLASKIDIYDLHLFVLSRASNTEPGLFSWEHQLRTLLKNPEERRHVQHDAHAWVLRNASWARDAAGGWLCPQAARWENFFLALAGVCPHD